MSLLGIDVGTTGCKTAAFTSRGLLLGSAYEEYDIHRPAAGWAVLDTTEVLQKIKRTIQKVTPSTSNDPVTALSVSSMGEAVVPVTMDRKILDNSILNFDLRGEGYLPDLASKLIPEMLYNLNGNLLGNQYSLTKLKWIKHNQPELYSHADLFLHWSSFVAFMLGAEPRLDFSLANRTLLFDLERCSWSEPLLEAAGLDREKLPETIPSGKPIGQVDPEIASELGLPPGVSIISGTHDQCSNALGCGVIKEGQAAYGMGTYVCVTPVFHKRKVTQAMLQLGLNTEHHAVPGTFVCFIYNMGGAIVKWFRDTFCAMEHLTAKEKGQDVYFDLFAEMDAGPSPVLVLPHFSATGPPGGISDSNGAILGLNLETKRADILKAILEANVFSLLEVIDKLPRAEIQIEEYRTAGGGSKSDAGLQICADILGNPVIRPVYTEAGALGAAILAGVGTNLFSSFESAVDEMVKMERIFEPNFRLRSAYQERFKLHQQIWPTFGPFLESM